MVNRDVDDVVRVFTALSELRRRSPGMTLAMSLSRCLDGGETLLETIDRLLDRYGGVGHVGQTERAVRRGGDTPGPAAGGKS